VLIKLRNIFPIGKYFWLQLGYRASCFKIINVEILYYVKSEWSNHEGCWQVILEWHSTKAAFKDPENVDNIIYLRVASR
jgi:hypothetical protein